MNEENNLSINKGYQYVSRNGFIEASHIIRDNPFSMDHFHTHDHYELYYLIEGSRKYIIDNRQFEVTPGDLVLIGRHVEHKTIESGPQSHQRFLLAVKPFENDLWPEMKTALDLAFIDKYTVISHTSIIALELRHIIERIIFLSRSDDTATDILIYTLLIQMLIYIARHKKQVNTEKKVSSGEKTDLIGRAVKYIENNYNRCIKLDDIAKSLFMSQAHLSRIFKSSTGISPGDYLNNVRIEKARSLLLETNLPVHEIAEKTGFGSISQFNRQIKHHLKISPLQYRKLYAR